MTRNCAANRTKTTTTSANQHRDQEPYRNRRVYVTARESRDTACYTIRDEGPGFDLALASVDPTDSKNLDRPGGRGLFLIRTFMHDVQFNARGNEITMTHRRSRTPFHGRTLAHRVASPGLRPAEVSSNPPLPGTEFAPEGFPQS